MLLTLLQLCGLIAGAAFWFCAGSDPLGRNIAHGVAALVLACVAISLLLRLCASWLPPLAIGAWVFAALPFAVAGWNYLSRRLRSGRA
jgi:hypothetical protein